MTSVAATKSPPEPFAFIPGTDTTGQPIFSVLVKRSYRIEDRQHLCRIDTKSELRKIDKYYDGGDPLTTTVQYENETAGFKPLTDVVVIGNAHTPEGIECLEMDVCVEIGHVMKVIRIIGDRRCQYRKGMDPRIGEPLPFTTMPIRYELAYGGKDEKSNPKSPFFYPRNYQGRGIVIKNRPELVDDLQLPNIEDPADLLSPDRIILDKPERWVDQPMPQGFGWYSRTWYPRSIYAGAVPGFMDIDCLTAEEKLGLVPANHVKLARRFKLPMFDIKFNNGASPGLALPYLRGDEQLRIVNMTKVGDLCFKLPGEKPSAAIDIGFGSNTPDPVMQTVCVRTEDLEVDIIWSFSVPYPGISWLSNMKKLKIEVV
ncbi:MAG: DUF2169 domain-containing protein [Fibrobacter sp.]|nr:DUF2169 domain-containing protein [Fibrobacter sp.]